MGRAKDENHNQFIFKHRLKSGEIRDVEVYSGPIVFDGETLLYSIVHDITERKLAEEEIQRKEMQLRTAQKVGHIGSWEIDFNSGKVDASEETRRIYGLEDEQLSTERIQKVPLPEYRRMLDKALSDLVEKNCPYEVYFRIKRHADGNIHDIKSVAEYYAQSNMVIGTIQDITEQKKKDEMLQQQHEFLERLLEAIPNPVFYKNVEGEYTGCNKAFEDFLGMNREDIIGKTVNEIGPKELADKYSENDKEIFDKPGKQYYEWQAQRKDGEVMDVVFNEATLMDLSGDVTGIVGVISDITPIKRAEEELHLREERLRSLVSILQYKTDSVQNFLDFALNEAIKLTQSKIGYIYYYNEGKKEFSLNTWSRDVMKECAVTEPQTTYKLENTGIWGEAVRQHRTIIVNDFQAPNPLKKGYPEGHVELYRYITVPVSKKGQIVAVVG